STSTLTNNQVVTCVLTSSSACGTDATLGTANTINATNSGIGVAYPSYYGNGRQQYLIRASELTALGFSAGNITSLGFEINSTVGNPATLNGYTIKIGTTASSVTTTTFQNPTFTNVFGPLDYTPTVNSLNIHTFNTPFVWNG